jgi:hypothetical protein
LPAISLGASGVALLRTRAPLGGFLMVLTAAGVLASALARSHGDASLAEFLLVASLTLPGGMSVQAYPRAGLAHPVGFCAWVVVAGAGISATIGARNLTLYSSMAPALGLTLLALTVHLWWRFEKSDEPEAGENA